MKRFNQILNIIIVAAMIGATITLVALVIIDGTGHHMISILYYYLLIMIAGTIALLLTPKDLYDGYIPEPDRSVKYEKIQRDLYDKGYDMSKDIEYDDFEPSGFDYCDYCDYGYDDEL